MLEKLFKGGYNLTCTQSVSQAMDRHDNKQRKQNFLWKIRPIKLNKLMLNSLFIIALLILVMISGKSYWQLKSLTKANHRVIHTYKIIEQVDSALYTLTAMESAQRAYLITENRNFLKDAKTFKPILNDHLNNLKALTNNYVEQHERVLQFIKLAEERVALLAQLAELKNKKQFNTPDGLANFYENNEVSEQVKSQSGEIKAIEEVLLKARNDALMRGVYASELFIIFGSLLSMILLIVPFVLANFELINRKIIEYRNRDVQNYLKQILESTSDGIAAIDEDHQIQIFNELYQTQFKKIFDCSLTQGMTFEKAFATAPDNKHNLTEIWLNSLRYDKEITVLEIEYEGKKNIFELSASPIINERNEINGLVHNISDITNRVREHTELEESYKKLTASIKELEIKNEQITLMIDMSDIMLATNSLEELSSIMGKYAQQLLTFCSGYLYVMHPSKNHLEMVGRWGTPTIQESIFNPEQCWAIRLGRPHKIVQSHHELVCDHFHFEEDVMNTIMCVPLMAQNDIYGLLYMEIANESFTLNHDQQLLITAFAELTALALANVRLRDNLRHQSIRDPLTGLFNRRFLEDGLFKQKLRAKSEKSSFAILMLDLDHFKKINDTFGHDAGDMTLKEIGSLLEQATQVGDLASRYGGEEFVVILNDIDIKNALTKAEQIRLAVTKIHLKYGAQPIGPISISIGIAIYPTDSEDTDKLIELADKALYAAKKKGRNTVVAFSGVKEQNL